MQITTPQGNIYFVYDATGRKWAKSGPEGLRWYVDNAEFLDGKIQHVAFADGRFVAEYDENGTFQGTYRVEYFRTDHLGNTRLTFSDFNHDGIISPRISSGTPTAYDSEITSENHYYPFGLSHTGPWYASIAPENKYRYNGKEWNADWGLNMYDYRARWYMSDLGRWNSPDILAEAMPAYAPYSFGFDNPIVFSDPTGMAPSGSDAWQVMMGNLKKIDEQKNHSNVDDIIIRAKNINGDYQEVIRVKSDVIDKTIDLDVPGLTLHEPISNAPIQSSITIDEIVPGVSFDEFISGTGKPVADAWSIDFQGAIAVKLGLGASISLAGFLNGPDAGDVFGYIQGSGHGGFAAGGGLSISAYYSNIPISKFGYQTLEGLEMGIQGSYGPFGASIFYGVGFPKPLYYGHSLGVSKGVPNTPKINATVYVGVSAKFIRF